MKYRVLSMYQPFATLLVHGIKKIETRSAPTNWTADKGIYLIHAAKKWDRNITSLIWQEPFYSALESLGYIWDNEGEPQCDLPIGCIIGSIEVVEYCLIHEFENKPTIISSFSKSYNVLNLQPGTIGFEIPEPELSYGDYTYGRYAWICQNPRVLKEPMPYNGGQGYYQNFHGDESKLIFNGNSN
ncbi:MAG: ASCH domain-containing protein [Atribacterota bacterium]|nr:ASCH domain-containing protein [Atribacterota bacterium]